MASTTKAGPARPDADLEAVRIYEALRKRIFQGGIRPGDELNQVHISQEYGVSRTPVREALRMLQADGLAEARFKYRMTVTPVTAEEIDQIYGLWIASQAVATQIAFSRLTRADLAACRKVLEKMSRLNGEVSSQWRALHEEFHAILNRPAGKIFCEKIEEYWHRTERARFSLEQTSPSLFGDDRADHGGLLQAYETGDIRAAQRINTHQLVRSATASIGIIDPGYTPVCIRNALEALQIAL
ncbi:GntR family transcriptional regulator [Pigmentiphaga sp.]|uniref:GntR family transcriptional regulator n=1 Tax=Pigmentiphaga sp. TaxID=1977564 RepID=UPI00128BF6B7|nr:GntR family transcriptional regulator [Pigmentiphaga sp.]MPS26508.1 GntR family transcriptional regulator [Alcaligenaceae bacterium SAGV5]MPS53583.1 GntR family transcriptional regulator [Alcaligenaceae bacterium SAGV3]MPT57381.1 GntR family transcriptional regulator [Alcaligenaceae bacterium]